jgi:hypothetical protein
LTAGPSATDSQLAGIAAAETLWRAHGAPALGVRPGDALEIQFVSGASPLSHGLYDDHMSVIYINDDLTDAKTLAIVLAHEVGHAFGLVHVSPDVRRSVMNPGNLDVEPNDGDQRALEALWGVCE